MEILFLISVYLTFGFLFGALHLWRCGRCKKSFPGIGYKAAFLVLSALFQIPIIILYVLISLFDICESGEDA